MAKSCPVNVRIASQPITRIRLQKQLMQIHQNLIIDVLSHGKLSAKQTDQTLYLLQNLVDEKKNKKAVKKDC